LLRADQEAIARAITTALSPTKVIIHRAALAEFAGTLRIQVTVVGVGTRINRKALVD
jgi:hypothetical protein